MPAFSHHRRADASCTRAQADYIEGMDQQKPKTEPAPAEQAEPKPTELGGAKRDTDPARYGDWEINGKCVDF